MRNTPSSPLSPAAKSFAPPLAPELRSVPQASALNSSRLGRRWIDVTILAFLAWTLATFALAPRLGTTDVFLFRDAAINFATGHGFQTASYEHSLNFQPQLYSSYTPGSLWAYLPFAAAFGGGVRAASAYELCLLLIVTLTALSLVLPSIARREFQWALVALFLITIPVGYVGVTTDRPETLSFLGLLFEAVLLRRRLPLWIAGLLAGVLFLVQPFAGVLGVCLIAIAWLFDWLPRRERSILHKVLPILLGALGFLVPVTVTAVSFHQIDPTSLTRFKNQAVVGGLNRTAETAASGAAGSAKVSSPVATGLGRYRSAVHWHLSIGPLNALSLAGAAVSLAVWLFLLVSARGSLWGRLALFACGFFTLLFPFLAFPLQLNYLTLGRVLFPFLLLLNIGGIAATVRYSWIPAALVALNLLLVLPATGLSLLTRSETRASYQAASEQAARLHKYLDAKGASNQVVLVPATHYYLYKPEWGRIFDSGYLSGSHPAKEIAAVVNCPTATSYQDGAEKPLPEPLDPAQWTLWEGSGAPLEISLLHHRMMRKNWALGCAVYVPRPGAH